MGTDMRNVSSVISWRDQLEHDVQCLRPMSLEFPQVPDIQDYMT